MVVLSRRSLFRFLSLLALILFPLAFSLSVSAETVKIIAEDDWFPYSGIDKDGLSQGIAVDIVREAFGSVGVDVELEVMNYDRGMLLVKDGQAIGCFDTPRTKEMEDIYFWHDDPLFTAKSYFYANADYPGSINSPKDIGGRVLGLTQGYGYGDAIDMNDDLNKEYSKRDEVILKKLIAKRVDFIVLYDRVADYLVSRLNVSGEIKPVGLSETTDLYIAFSKKHPEGREYRDKFSVGLKKIKGNGTYDAIWRKWDDRLKAGAEQANGEEAK